MNAPKVGLLALACLSVPFCAFAAPGTVTGKVTLSGAAPKYKPLDLSKQPECVRLHASNPLYPENVVTGPGNSLRNVVVYISAGENDTAPTTRTPAVFDQHDCHYTTHVLAVRVGQEISVSNSDPFSHNIHPLARINREWNKMQLPGTPAFSYAYDHEEFIPIRCNIHPWMQGYFVVLKTGHFSVTDETASSRSRIFLRAITSSPPGTRPSARKLRKLPFPKVNPSLSISPSPRNPDAFFTNL